MGGCRVGECVCYTHRLILDDYLRFENVPLQTGSISLWFCMCVNEQAEFPFNFITFTLQQGSALTSY